MKKKELLHFQEREEVRKEAQIDIAFRMLYAGEAEGKIVKYTHIDFELLRRMNAVKEDLARQESEAKSRAMKSCLRMRELSPLKAFLR